MAINGELGTMLAQADAILRAHGETLTAPRLIRGALDELLVLRQSAGGVGT